MKQFESKDEFNKWIADRFQRTIMQQLEGYEPSEDEIVSRLLEEGYTDLDNLVADGHAYEIGGHTNHGWVWEDETDGFSGDVEIKKRERRGLEVSDIRES